MGRRHRLSAPAALLAAAVLPLSAACSDTTNGRPVGSSGASGSSSRAGSAAPSAPSPSNPDSSRPACPKTYAPPDPNRPTVSLTYLVSADHATVAGNETITFTPDQPVDKLVFRLTANTKPSVQQDNKIVVKSASSSMGGGRFTFTRANADPSTQGGLLVLPLRRRVAAGTAITAGIAFQLTLGQDSFDRFGRSGKFAYFGSGHPLLAWERGYGWHTEDMLNFAAESATSEAMDTTLTVTAPKGDVVIASGNPTTPSTTGSTRIWRSRLAAARDVAVSVGPFQVRDTTVNGVQLRVGAYDAQTARSLMPEFTRAITELAKRFGPFPYPSLAVARVPAQGGGIEYPGAILMLDGSRLVAVHETAHEWFYGMLGDSQSQHPWLDEAFATYSQELVDNSPSHEQDLRQPGAVDRSTQSYGTDERGYYFTTYNKGSAALEKARAEAGATKWDAAVKCYVARNAWRIVNPGDLRASIAGLPKGVAVLQKAGALT